MNKQETLEEAAEKSAIEEFEAGNSAYILGFINGVKWQQEQDKLDEDNIRLDERCKCELENITTFSEGYDAGISQQERSYSEELFTKDDLIAFYEFIKKECDIVNSAGYAETHTKWFIEQFKKK